MSRGGKLITGLIGLIVIWLIMLVFKWSWIETDLGSRAQRALTESGLGWVNVDVNHRGREVLLSGLTRNEADQHAAEELVKQVEGVRTVDAGAIVYRPLKQARLTLKSTNNRVLLSGYLRSEATSRELADRIDNAIAMPVDSVIHNGQDYEVPEWLDQVPDVVQNISYVEQLALDVDQGGVKVSGIVRSDAERQRVADQISTLPGINSADITDLKLIPYTPSSFLMTATESGSTVTGKLRSDAEANQLISLLSPSSGTITAQQLTLDDGTAPGDWLDDLAKVAADLSVVEALSAGFDSGALRISGMVREQSDYDAIAAWAPKMSVVETLDLSALEVRLYIQPWFEIEIVGKGASLRGMARHEDDATRLVEVITRGNGVVTQVTSEMEVSADVVGSHWGSDINRLVQTFSSIEQGTMRLRDGALTLGGIVRNESQYHTLLKQAGNSNFATSVEASSLALRPFRSPRFSLSSSREVVLVSGLFGKQSDADQLSEAVHLVFGDIASVQLLLDPDVSQAEWIIDVMRMMPSLTGLESSSLNVSDSVIELTGLARTREAYELVRSAIDSASTEVINNNIDLRPWQQPTLDISASDQRVEAVGMMPDQMALDSIEKKLTSLGIKMGLPRETVMAVGADVQNSEWLSKLVELIPELSLLEQPRLRAAEGVVTIGGTASSRLDAQNLIAMVNKAVPGLKTNNLIEVRLPPPEPEPEDVEVPAVANAEVNRCEQDLDRVMNDNNIEFATGSADLSPTSNDILITLLTAVRACPDVVIEVSGHTDNLGSDANNLVLSEQRASAVVDYLVTAGVAPGKLVARGYGSERPIGDNATESGRTTNRRIEFNIKTRGN